MHVLMISVTEASVVDRSGVFACSVDMHAKRDTGPGCMAWHHTQTHVFIASLEQRAFGPPASPPALADSVRAELPSLLDTAAQAYVGSDRGERVRGEEHGSDWAIGLRRGSRVPAEACDGEQPPPGRRRPCTSSTSMQLATPFTMNTSFTTSSTTVQNRTISIFVVLAGPPLTRNEKMRV